MKISATFFSFFLFLTTQAQSNLWHITDKAFFRLGPSEYYSLSPKQKNHFTEKCVKSRITHRYAKGKSWVIEEKFNEQGNLVSYEKMGKKYSYKSSATYNEQNQPVQYKVISSKGKETLYNLFYENEKLVRTQKTDPKGKISGRIIEYDQNGNSTHIAIYEKTATNITQELIYEFYEDGKRKRTTYKKKGKEKYTWNYDCDPEGIEVKEIEKSTTKICLSEEYDEDDNRVVWKREIDTKGHLRKMKFVYNKENQLIHHETYHENGQLMNATITVSKNHTRNVYYTKSGEVSNSNDLFYDDAKRLIRRIDHFRNSETVYLYAYNGELREMKTSISKHGLVSSQITYEFRDN